MVRSGLGLLLLLGILLHCSSFSSAQAAGEILCVAQIQEKLVWCVSNWDSQHLQLPEQVSKVDCFFNRLYPFVTVSQHMPAHTQQQQHCQE
jgi:hypothetical protein